MKTPVTNISKDLSSQRAPGRKPEVITTQSLRTGGPTMTVPGEGGVALAPGAQISADERQSRSAGVFGDAMARFGGKRSDA